MSRHGRSSRCRGRPARARARACPTLSDPRPPGSSRGAVTGDASRARAHEVDSGKLRTFSRPALPRHASKPARVKRCRFIMPRLDRGQTIGGRGRAPLVFAVPVIVSPCGIAGIPDLSKQVQISSRCGFTRPYQTYQTNPLYKSKMHMGCLTGARRPSPHLFFTEVFYQHGVW